MWSTFLFKDELLMNKIDDHYEDDSDDKHNVSISAEESEDLPAAGNEAMVIQDYDTRSEIGTSSSETSLTDSNSESCEFVGFYIYIYILIFVFSSIKQFFFLRELDLV